MMPTNQLVPLRRAKAAFSFSVDGLAFTPSGGHYMLSSYGYRGDMIGIYTVADSDQAGFIDVDYFHCEFVNR